MKKYVLLLALTAALAGCAALQNRAPDYRKMMVGSWMLNDVSIEGQEGSFKVSLFNEASLECFIGSAWTLTRPNSLGTYTLNAGTDCQAGLQRNIRWTIHKTATGEQQFQFKRLDEAMDPMDNNVGYRLDILSMSESHMELREEVDVNGEPLFLVFSFSR